MTTPSTGAAPTAHHHDSRDQQSFFAGAETTLPGASLGGHALPEDVRFVIRRGAGSRVQSVDGRWYVDWVCGAGANILGHAHPAVVEAVQARVADGMHFFGTMTDVAIELAEKIVAIVPCAERVAFTTTGSEATFYALRMARAYTGRDKILKFEGGYHGNHDYAAVSLFPKTTANYPAGSVDTGGVPEALPSTVLVAPYNDLDTVESIVREHAGEIAAIIVEPVQRILFPRPGFLEGLRRICDEHDLLLVFDEVVTGFRLALGGAQERFGVIPDLAAYGKIVGGGGPLGAVAGRAEIVDRADPGNKGTPGYAFVNGTLHGNPVAAAAGLATIGVLEEPGFYERLRAGCESLTTALQRVLDRHRVPALVAGRDSFWQILGTRHEPASQGDVLASDQALARALDVELLRAGAYVIPGTRRFTCAAHTDADLTLTADALDEACVRLNRQG